jgi:hypothetical protein
VAAKKLTDAQREDARRLHADDGLSYRTLASMFGVTKTVIERACRPAGPGENRGTDDGTDGTSTGPEAAPSGPPAKPERVHAEGAFPDLPPDEMASEVVIEPSYHDQARARREAFRAERERESREVERQNAAERNERLAKLEAEWDATPPNTPEWWKMRKRVVAMRKAMAGPAYLPLPSQTGVPMGEQTLTDRPPRALWENPYDHGPRGFTIVGS